MTETFAAHDDSSEYSPREEVQRVFQDIHEAALSCLVLTRDDAASEGSTQQLNDRLEQEGLRGVPVSFEYIDDEGDVEAVPGVYTLYGITVGEKQTLQYHTGGSLSEENEADRCFDASRYRVAQCGAEALLRELHSQFMCADNEVLTKLADLEAYLDELEDGVPGSVLFKVAATSIDAVAALYTDNPYIDYLLVAFARTFLRSDEAHIIHSGIDLVGCDEDDMAFAVAAQVDTEEGEIEQLGIGYVVKEEEGEMSIRRRLIGDFQSVTHTQRVILCADTEVQALASLRRGAMTEGDQYRDFLKREGEDW